VNGLKKISSSSSVDSISPEYLLSDIFSSDELDKLSGCLSEVSSESGEQTSNSVFHDIVQAQLALLTYVASLLYSYAWQQHRKKFLLTMVFVVPTVFSIACGVSMLITLVVILTRLFTNGPFDYSMFTMTSCTNQRRRTPSGQSRKSSMSCRSSISLSDDHQPPPLCRRHSAVSSGSRPPSRNSSRAPMVSSQWSFGGSPVEYENPGS